MFSNRSLLLCAHIYHGILQISTAISLPKQTFLGLLHDIRDEAAKSLPYNRTFCKICFQPEMRSALLQSSKTSFSVVLPNYAQSIHFISRG